MIWVLSLDIKSELKFFLACLIRQESTCNLDSRKILKLTTEHRKKWFDLLRWSSVRQQSHDSAGWKCNGELHGTLDQRVPGDIHARAAPSGRSVTSHLLRVLLLHFDGVRLQRLPVTSTRHHMRALEHQQRRRRGDFPRDRELLSRTIRERCRHFSDRIRPGGRHRHGWCGLQHLRDPSMRCVIGNPCKYTWALFNHITINVIKQW